ncbi:MAG: hypothetical protein GW873_06380 [Nitrospirae bacterium]|nr:hypothetical protein [Nitrospirota bacterium]OIP60871.1 MAG: hypothetical protein AUK38_02270 [Nitrospirae bacterium CG2_30_41_42]
MNEIIKNLKNILSDTVRRSFYKGLLFSGGLDTSILASLNAKVVSITVSLESEADDIPYAVSLAKHLNMKHFHRKVEIDEAIENIPCLIKILKSFDPALPNDLAVYFGLEFAKDQGLDIVATGDGSDELFGGYAFMKDIADLESYIQKISQRMSFSSNNIGKFFRIKIIQPFMDKEIIDFALQIPVDLKIRRYNGKVCGKWILRKAFEDILPKELIWQDKRPLEYGSGMHRLREIISSEISDDEFEEKQRIYSVNFLNKEHLYYYEIYRREVGEIPLPKEGEKPCPGCKAGIEVDAFHCKVCGYVSDWRSE